MGSKLHYGRLLWGRHTALIVEASRPIGLGLLTDCLPPMIPIGHHHHRGGGGRGTITTTVAVCLVERLGAIQCPYHTTLGYPPRP